MLELVELREADTAQACTLYGLITLVSCPQVVLEPVELREVDTARAMLTFFVPYMGYLTLVSCAQVVLELVELREVDTARAMLRQTAVFAGMKQEEPDRFLRLEHLCGRAYFDVRHALGSRF